MRSSYLPLLRLPGAWRFSLAALVGRMPISMLGIGTVLLVQDRRGSYALAGAVAGAYALGLAAVGPVVSRLVDRRGQAAVLPVAAVVSTSALLLLVAAAGSAVPGAALLGLAAVAGATLPPLGACARARWAATLVQAGRPGEVGTAFALEAVVDELVFVLGPALVVALGVVAGPATALLAAAALSVAGTLSFVLQRSTEPPVEVRLTGSGGSALRVPGLRTTTLSMVFVGVVFGGMEVVMVAFSGEQGRPAAAGVLLPLIAAGSAVSGLVYGARAWRSPVDRRFVTALAALSAGVVPLVLAPSVPAMVPAALLAGVAISPTLIAAFGLAERLVPSAVRTEAFAWLNSGLGAGVALGSAVAGSLADGPGARAAFLTCVLGALVALAVGVAGRRTLAALPVPPPVGA